MRTTLSFRKLLDGMIVLLLAVTAWRMLSLAGDAPADPEVITNVTPAIKRGDLLRLPGVMWSTPRTVLLVVSSTCRACNENLAFYRQVGGLATSTLGVVAVSAERAGLVGDWFRAHNVGVRRIYQLNDPASFALTLTPMVIIVDARGRVTDLMIRRLDETGQARVLERLHSPNAPAADNSQQIREISTSDLETMRSHGRIQILDPRIRDRFQDGHRAEARNIPYTELDVRAPIELDRGTPVIVDCLQRGASACRGAAWTLVDAGFGDVFLLIR